MNNETEYHQHQFFDNPDRFINPPKCIHCNKTEREISIQFHPKQISTPPHTDEGERK